MVGLSPAVRVYVALPPVDMRKSFDGLAALVRSSIGRDVLSGDLFVFSNRHRDRLKVLYWDGSGLWVCAKRLERGCFAWPKSGDGGCVNLSTGELTLLLEGIDLDRASKRNWLRIHSVPSIAGGQVTNALS